MIFNNRLIEEANIIIPDEELDWAFVDSAVRSLTFSKQEGKSESSIWFLHTNLPFPSLWSIIHGDKDKIIDDKAYNLILRWHREARALPNNMLDCSFGEAWQLFAMQGRVGIMLGNVRAVYQMRNLQQIGKGFEITVKEIPSGGKNGLFLDQVAAYGIIKTENREKLDLCVSFLKMLIEEGAQRELKQIGAFSVISSVRDIYQTIHR